MIQDYILAIGNAILFLALIPSIISRDKPALTTSLLTGTILSIFAVTMATLSLYLTAIMTASSAILWAVLAWQKWRKK